MIILMDRKLRSTGKRSVIPPVFGSRETICCKSMDSRLTGLMIGGLNMGTEDRGPKLYKETSMTLRSPISERRTERTNAITLEDTIRKGDKIVMNFRQIPKAICRVGAGLIPVGRIVLCRQGVPSGFVGRENGSMARRFIS